MLITDHRSVILCATDIKPAAAVLVRRKPNACSSACLSLADCSNVVAFSSCDKASSTSLAASRQSHSQAEQNCTSLRHPTTADDNHSNAVKKTSCPQLTRGGPLSWAIAMGSRRVLYRDFNEVEASPAQ